MRSLRSVVALLALFGGWQQSAAQDVRSKFIEGTYTAEISPETFANLPHWKPGDGDPPITARDAKREADRVFAEIDDPKRFPDWKAEFSRLELQILDRQDWIWVARYDATWKGRALYDDTVGLSIPVLMNGEAVKPSLEFFIEYTDEELQKRAERAFQHNAPKNGPWKYGSFGIRGKPAATVTLEMLAATPDWKPSDNSPPASFVQAYAEALRIQQQCGTCQRR